MAIGEALKCEGSFAKFERENHMGGFCFYSQLKCEAQTCQTSEDLLYDEIDRSQLIFNLSSGASEDEVYILDCRAL